MRNLRYKELVLTKLMAALMLLGGLGACGKSADSETLVADANQFTQKGEHKAALIQLKNALVQNPGNIEARLAIGALYNETGDPLSAEKEFRKAIELGASADKTTLGLAKALLAKRELQQVLDITEAAAKGKDVGIFNVRGSAFHGLGRLDDAKKSFEAALALEAENATALTGMARLALADRDVPTATTAIDKAVAANPADTDAMMFKAGMLRAGGKNDEARAIYQKVLKLKPNYVDGYIEKAQMEIGERKFDAAKADVAAMRAIAPKNLGMVYTSALLHFSQAQYPAAKEELQKLLAVAPEHMPSVLMMGVIESAQGSLPQSEANLRKYLSALPGNTHARKLLSRVLLRQGRAADAKEVLAPLLASDGADGLKDAEVLGLAGEVAMQERDFDKAADWFERASALQPNVAGLRTSLAMSKLAQGDEAGAIAQLEQSTKLDTSAPQAAVALTLTELRAKRYDKALAAITKLEAARPKDPMVHNLKGGVFLGMGKKAEARAAFEKALALDPGYHAAVSNLVRMDVTDNRADAAKQRLVQFLEKNKKSASAMNDLADLALKAGRTAEATEWLEKASAENPGVAGPVIRLGNHYLSIGEPQKALTLARKHLAAEASNAELLELLGRAQVANKDHAGALDTYGKLAGLLPQSGMVRLRLAGVQLLMNNTAGATTNLEKALALEPNLVDAHVALAEVAMRGGKPDQAIAMAQQLQKRQPTLPVGYALEGRLLQVQGKHAAAVRPLEQAFKMAPTSPGLVTLHMSKSKVDGGKGADAQLQQWMSAHPADLTVPLYMAERLLEQKQYKQAVTLLESVLKAAPKNALALNNLAWAYQQTGDARARKTAEQAYLIAGANPAIMDTLGWILVEEGNTAKGVPLLQEAVKLAPNATDIRFHLAQAMAKSGDKAGAKTHLDKVLSDKSFADVDAAKAFQKRL